MIALRNKIPELIRSDDGFTLLEVAFAGAIMVIVGLAYLGTISQSISIAQLYTDQNQANIVIEREIEVLRNTAFDEVLFGTGDIYWEDFAHKACCFSSKPLGIFSFTNPFE